MGLHQIYAFLLNFLYISQILRTNVVADIACNSTSDCHRILIAPGVSICENGFCTNPFEQGCLKAMGGKYGKKNITRIKHLFDNVRICNSDDKEALVNSEDLDNKHEIKDWTCRKPNWLEHIQWDEVRIGNMPWGTAIAFSWLFQIILMEFLEVPATIEHGIYYAPGEGSFYQRTNVEVVYASYVGSDQMDLILETHNVEGDCRKSENPCAHVLPE